MRKYKIVLYVDEAGEHRFRIVAPNGKTVPDGYKRRIDRDKSFNRLVAVLSTGSYVIVDEEKPR